MRILCVVVLAAACQPVWCIVDDDVCLIQTQLRMHTGQGEVLATHIRELANAPTALASQLATAVNIFTSSDNKVADDLSALSNFMEDLTVVSNADQVAEAEVSALTGFEPFPADQKLKVVYGLFTSPKPKYAKQLQSVTETWAKDVPPQRLLIVGVSGNTSGVAYTTAPQCPDGHVESGGISCKEATLLATGYASGADWVVVAGSDNYVFPRNFDERLSSEDPNQAQILGLFGCGGGQYCEDGQNGLCGGGGYAISRAALDKMVGNEPGAGQDFIEESMRTSMTVGGGWSDQVTACIGRRNGVKEVQLNGLYGWQFCHEGANYVEPPDGGVLMCPFADDIYRDHIQNLVAFPKPLTFHYILPDVMHKIHAMSKEVKKKEVELLSKPVESAVPCADTHMFCTFWAHSGECPKNPKYMTQVCRSSCGHCKAAPKPPVSVIQQKETVSESAVAAAVAAVVSDKAVAAASAVVAAADPKPKVKKGVAAPALAAPAVAAPAVAAPAKSGISTSLKKALRLLFKRNEKQKVKKAAPLALVQAQAGVQAQVEPAQTLPVYPFVVEAIPVAPNIQIPNQRPESAWSFLQVSVDSYAKQRAQYIKMVDKARDGGKASAARKKKTEALEASAFDIR